MCFGGPPSMPAPPPPAPLPPVAQETDPEVKAARDSARRRAQAMVGYGGTIATSGLGVPNPASNTTGVFGAARPAGFKALLGL